MLSEEIIQESSFYRDILEKGLNQGLIKGRNEGLAEGRNEGLAEGRSEEARRVIAQLVSVRFPGLEVPALAGLSLEQLESLFDALLRAGDRDAARRELARLAG